MPIRPENRKRYPKDWKLRSRFIRTYRAKNRCEWCGIPNYAVGQRSSLGRFMPLQGCLWMDMAGQGLWKNGEPLTYKAARTIADDLNQANWMSDDEPRYIVVVLTVAHVHDHRPEAASFLNLAALCQKCHNDHDSKMRRNNAKKRRNNQQREFAFP